LIEAEHYTADNTAPVTTISDTNGNRRNTDVTFTLSGTDAGTGMGTTYYKTLSGGINQTCSAGGYTAYSTAVTIAITAGNIFTGTVCYYSVDGLGNTESATGQNYQIDKSDPTINPPTIYGGTRYGVYFKGTISLSGSYADTGAGVAAGSCRISINGAARTGAGVTQSTPYCIYNSYNPAATFSGRFLVKDDATNTGISNTNTYTYDATQPTLTTPVIYVGTTYNDAYYKDTISIQSTGTDT